MLGFIIEEGESRTQCDIMCYFIHWPPGGALLRQRHSLINSGPHTGPLSRLFWECRRCTYYNPKLNPNLSCVCGMACYTYSTILLSLLIRFKFPLYLSELIISSDTSLFVDSHLSRLGRRFPTPAFG